MPSSSLPFVFRISQIAGNFKIQMNIGFILQPYLQACKGKKHKKIRGYPKKNFAEN
jgi:hypothetical protein